MCLFLIKLRLGKNYNAWYFILTHAMTQNLVWRWSQNNVKVEGQSLRERERESLCACTIAEIRELDGSKFKLIITEKTHEILFTDEIKIKMMNLALPDWQRVLYQNEMLRMLSLKNGEPETKSHYLYLAEIFYFKSYLIFKDN